MTAARRLSISTFGFRGGGAGGTIIVGGLEVAVEDATMVLVEQEISMSTENAEALLAGEVRINASVESAISVAVESNPIVVVVETGVCDGS